MSTHCCECHTAFKREPSHCPCCGADVEVVDNITDRDVETQGEYNNKMVRHILNALIEKVYPGPATEEFWNGAIEETMTRLKSYIIGGEK